MTYNVEPVGVIHSCFKDKFGVPRQPGLVREARGELELFAPYDRDEALKGLESFSHLWIIFVFHQALGQEQRLSVRPPRLGGNQKLGVFATRSSHRPNAIGMSVVEFAGVCRRDGKTFLGLRGLDMIEGTPVLDIKPYLPYVDAIADVRADFAHAAPTEKLEVVFSEQAQQQCRQWQGPDLESLITAVVSQDPRPAYQQNDISGRVYGVRLYNIDVRWQVSLAGKAEVVELLSVDG